MSSPQTLDAAMCLLASLISKQVANSAQLKRDLELGARHFQASNAELADLLGRMAAVTKAVEPAVADGPSAADMTQVQGKLAGVQALLFSVIRAMDNCDEAFAQFSTETVSAQIGLTPAAQESLNQFVNAVQRLRQEL